MGLQLRVKPRWPIIVQGTGGIIVTQSGGRATIGFDYDGSELGSELQQAVDATAADAVATAADVVSAAASATAAAASASSITNPLLTFGTKAIAEAATIADTVKFCTLAGYTNEGDGPRANYIRTDSEPSHEGKFRSTDRYLSDGTVSSGNGGWWVLAEPRSCPQWFGGIPLGGGFGDPGDCTTAIQNAIDYLGGESTDGTIRTGGVVFFPRPLDSTSYYRCDSELTLANRQNVTLEGDAGRDSSFFNTPISAIVYAGTASIFIDTINTWSTSFSLKRLGIYYIDDAFEGDLVVSRSLGFEAENCAFGWYSVGSPFAYSARSGICLRNAHSLRIINCMFGQMQNGIYVPAADVGDGVPSQLRVLECQFYDIQFAGIHIDPAGQPMNGAFIHGCLFNTINLSYALGSAQYGIYGPFNGASISGCSFTASNGATSSLSGAAISIAGIFAVTGCLFQTPSIGVIQQSGNCTLLGNEFTQIAVGFFSYGGLVIADGNHFAHLSRSVARSTAYQVGDIVDAGSSDVLLRCTTAGTTDSGAPTYPTTVGGTVSDGTVTWTAIPQAAMQFGVDGFTGGSLGGRIGVNYYQGSSWAWSLYSAGSSASTDKTIEVSYDPSFDGSTNKIKSGFTFTIRSPERVPLAIPSTTTLTPAYSGRVLNNSGAAGTVTLTLPPSEPGLRFEFTQHTSNRNLVIACDGSELILNPGAAGVSTLTNTASSTQVGATLVLEGYTVSRWRVVSITGTWA